MKVLFLPGTLLSRSPPQQLHNENFVTRDVERRVGCGRRQASHLGRDGGVGHGGGHGDEAVHAAEADSDLEQLGHLCCARLHHNNSEFVSKERATQLD